LQWLQYRSQISGDNLDKVRYGTSRNFRNKKREYLKKKLMRLKQTVRLEISESYAEA